MVPSLVDHLLFALIVVAYPVYATLVWFRRMRPQLEAGKAGALFRFYGETIIELWLLTAVVVSWWFLAGRTSTEIGLGIPGGWKFWVGLIIAAASAIALGYQLSMVRSSAEVRIQVRKQLGGSTALIVPRNDRERRMAIAVSLTAGFCEEVLYRAFFMLYLMIWLPGYAAVAVSAVVFGIAHVYLGRGGVLKAMAAGVIFGAAYLFTGSLWVSIALHATVDITSLLVGSIALEHEDSVAANISSDGKEE